MQKIDVKKNGNQLGSKTHPMHIVHAWKTDTQE
jgi:hypothetical protein